MWRMFSSSWGIWQLKFLSLKRKRDVVGTRKLPPPETKKSVKKTVVKKVRQHKNAAPLTEEIEKEIVRVADGFLEKAARSRVKCEKEIERQVLGNEGMAARSSVDQKRNAGKCA